MSLSPTNSFTVLLVEDDARLARLTMAYLQAHGVVVLHASDGLSGLQVARTEAVDVVLLDLMLPGLDGLEVCRRIRERSDVPIVMLTARDGEVDRVLGLELGADDYVSKPFSSPELLARLRAQVRRFRGLAGPGPSEIVQVGRLKVDPGSHTAWLGDEVLTLTTYEFDLLRVLAERPGRVLARETILDLVKGSADEAFDRSIDVHVSRLRQKLGDDARDPRMLKTVRGVGYVLTAEAQP
jgi:two-component system OmpR family response regulator